MPASLARKVREDLDETAAGSSKHCDPGEGASESNV